MGNDEERRLVPRGLRFGHLEVVSGRVVVHASTGHAPAECPCCGRSCSRAHSRYVRTLADLPWHGVVVRLRVRSRRMFCENAACERRIFCERLPDVAAHARKTARLEGALLAIVFELGGRAGARLAAELGLAAGRDALLRRAKSASLPDPGRVRVLGVDDFAFRKGHAYGTVLVDLERREVVDLLPERSQESLVAWLGRHPEVESGLSPSSKNVAALFVRREEKLSEEQKEYLGRLCGADAALADARRLTQDFAKMVRDREGDELEGWLEEAEASQAPAMRNFAAGLKKDLDAVRAGLTEEWSNGPVEGFVNKLKLVKRQGYGRAGFELLRARMLAA